MPIEIYFNDLKEEKQKEIVEKFGDNRNYDTFPIVTIDKNFIINKNVYDDDGK